MPGAAYIFQHPEEADYGNDSAGVTEDKNSLLTEAQPRVVTRDPSILSLLRYFMTANLTMRLRNSD